MNFRTIFYLTKKDLRLKFINKKSMIIFLTIPIVIMLFMKLIISTETSDLTIYIDQNLKSQFKSQDTIMSSYLGSPVKMAVKYLPKAELLDRFNKSEYGVVIYSSNPEGTIMHINANIPNSMTIYNLLWEYYYPPAQEKFLLKMKFSANILVLSMAINFLLLFSALTLGGQLMGLELKERNILLLMKAGIKKHELITSKLLTVLILQYISFTFFYLIAVNFDLMESSPVLFAVVPIIVIPTATLGIFMESIISEDSYRPLLTMLLWFPGYSYELLKNAIPESYQFILKFDPLVLVSEFISQVLKNDVQSLTVALLAICTVILLGLSTLFLNKTIIKNM